ncbi:LolA-related protein [bacterium endosymbiont of Bathymodiolus sp. 5 South]|uniref:LolA-related protein n=2 Tax=bacterium endosymbiont of Bathymodiolus sp. 5 South TaxID=1181670 RepID=UPI0010B3B61D|nr:LolA-related protein [bacterium endosymbiont of Bathymodiolus sp. 5 South]CAC9456882.1 hypothetical protein [uncultured Gammaproteobacteria bacterium]CAC9645583.1 hypothetical protein [uncultured Gammaproteobacteria bacterium]CAC9646805.1 hypothetical protein [uncultured Gammaproteobacteria bacterium]SHN90867.1 hypothetical protein BCLUESOX_1096 [bacterium endosymbiont of Bathymodiolus sp. 5 South]SSC07338.1 FIG027190: Putative transmembrane protein [bacterium endosymbiont of Bathymodiolus 
MNWFKFFLLLLMANPIVAYSEIEIADVFGLVSKNPNKSLKFVELRSATFFTEEIKTTGTVSFNDDGLMSKYIAAPRKSEIHITDNTLLLLDDNGKREILLANYPVLASGVNAIRWLLLGNKEKISNNYFIEYSNKLTDWKIKLIPRDSEVLSEISSILITGQLGSINVIKLSKSDGTSIITTFSQ